MVCSLYLCCMNMSLFTICPFSLVFYVLHVYFCFFYYESICILLEPTRARERNLTHLVSFTLPHMSCHEKALEEHKPLAKLAQNTQPEFQSLRHSLVI